MQIQGELMDSQSFNVEWDMLIPITVKLAWVQGGELCVLYVQVRASMCNGSTEDLFSKVPNKGAAHMLHAL
jgi:hypothetical protein